MGSHIIDGEFQSDKYPTTPRGKVPLSVKDPTAQDLLWEYAQRRRSVDAEFSDDLEQSLITNGYSASGSPFAVLSAALSLFPEGRVHRSARRVTELMQRLGDAVRAYRLALRGK